MKRTMMFSLISIGLLSMSTAMAGGGSLFSSSDSSMSAGSGMYLGGSVGQAKYRCMESDEDCENEGWKVYGGYKFTDNLAIEAAYYNLGEEEAHYENEAGSLHLLGKSSGVGVSGVYSHEIVDNLEVFGKLGAMFWQAEAEGELIYKDLGVTEHETAKEDGTSVLVGLGANYKFSENWGIRGEWERYTAEYEAIEGEKSDEDEDVDILSAGVTFSTY